MRQSRSSGLRVGRPYPGSNQSLRQPEKRRKRGPTSKQKLRKLSIELRILLPLLLSAECRKRLGIHPPHRALRSHELKPVEFAL
ncbi:MAG: hypothetical protein ACI9MB_000814, partial [Verrucomicrobiales bacterium]